MSLKKQYLKTKPICKVTFRFPRELAKEARSVHLVGEFNQWDIHATAMKQLKNGDFTVSIDLETGRTYQFRYLMDDTHWENDDQADRYEPTLYGDCDNSVVVV